MYRAEIREHVRRLIRDDTFPADSLNDALNRVLSEVGNIGVFHFQETSADLTLVAGTYQYVCPTGMIREKSLVWNPGDSNQVFLYKVPSWDDAVDKGRFLVQGNAPQVYLHWGDNFLFDPIPNTQAAAEVVRVFYSKEITLLTGDSQEPTIPKRWHNTLLVYGTAAYVLPFLKLQNSGQLLTATQWYSKMLREFSLAERWEAKYIPVIKHGRRWDNMGEFGHVSRVRG